MKRRTYEELAEWRRESVARYQEKRRKATRRATTPVTPQRARKQAEDAYYREQRALRVAEAGGRCEFLVDRYSPASRCMSRATQTHHVVRRSHQVDHDRANLRAFCAEHHLYVHEHVAWSKMMGYIDTAWDRIEGP